MDNNITIGNYLMAKLQQFGVRHVFGIPGDYVLGFYHMLEENPAIELINTCDEQGAGFAADAYARVSGLGAVCVTYGVGGLKIANTTAQAYAEKSPVVVISGCPGLSERHVQGLLHHQITDFSTQRRVFEQFTVDTAVITSGKTAQRDIERVLAAAMQHKRPVYIELPRDMVFSPITLHREKEQHVEKSNPGALKEALEEATALINRAKQPVILAGVEVHRFGLQDEVTALTREKNIPIAATILAKSIVPDTEPTYLGVFEGGTEAVTEYVEASDCLIMLGTFITDLNMGLFTSNIDPTGAIHATSERISIRHHRYEAVVFKEFIEGLRQAPVTARILEDIPRPKPPESIVATDDQTPITVTKLFQYLNGFIKPETMIIADVGDTLFAANDLFVHNATDFLSPAYYASLGFAVPGALGAQMANPYSRPLVLVGDGAFQMTGMELSSISRYGLNPIVVVLNNDGYSTERPMLDGPFNDVHPWNFSKLPEILGCGQGFQVNTLAELQLALKKADAYTEGFTIIDVRVDRDDRSNALIRLTDKLGQKVRRAE